MSIFVSESTTNKSRVGLGRFALEQAVDHQLPSWVRPAQLGRFTDDELIHFARRLASTGDGSGLFAHIRYTRTVRQIVGEF